MEIFIAPLIVLLLVVLAICGVIVASNRRGPSTPKLRDSQRRQRLERQQERFYRQQSWLFWKNIFK